MKKINKFICWKKSIVTKKNVMKRILNLRSVTNFAFLMVDIMRERCKLEKNEKSRMKYANSGATFIGKYYILRNHDYGMHKPR